MPKPNDPNANEPTANEPAGGTPTPTPGDGGQPAGGEPGDGGLKDKHGEDAINLGHHNRLMAEKDEEIAELKKQLKEAGKKAESGEEALKKVGELEARLEDEKVSGALRLAGCVNEKAAKALLEDYEGNVAKLKEGCPYLFGAAKQTGSTGARQGGAPSASEELVAKARAAAGTAYLYQK